MSIYEKYENELCQIQKIIENTLNTGNNYLNKGLSDVKNNFGKMIRPQLVLVGSQLGTKKNKDEVLQLAAVIEMLHLATLIHDDIVDEAKMRRGKEAIWHKYSKEYALYMGDYLLAQCFISLSEIDVNRQYVINLAKSMKNICIGEMKQQYNKYNTSITEYEYLKIISKKTALLLSISLASGAIHLNAKVEDIKKLYKIGFAIGMQFQLVDDMLDFFGADDIVGKDLKKDLIKGYYSYPIIYLLSKKEGNELKKILNDDELSEINILKIYDLVLNSNAINKTKELAIKYKNRALVYIEKIANKECKNDLYEILEMLENREF